MGRGGEGRGGVEREVSEGAELRGRGLVEEGGDWWKRRWRRRRKRRDGGDEENSGERKEGDGGVGGDLIMAVCKVAR